MLVWVHCQSKRPRSQSLINSSKQSINFFHLLIFWKPSGSFLDRDEFLLCLGTPPHIEFYWPTSCHPSPGILKSYPTFFWQKHFYGKTPLISVATKSTEAHFLSPSPRLLLAEYKIAEPCIHFIHSKKSNMQFRRKKGYGSNNTCRTRVLTHISFLTLIGLAFQK